MTRAAQEAGENAARLQARLDALLDTDHPAADDLIIIDMRSLRRVAEAEVAGIAWPTIILSLSVMSVFIASLFLAARGVVPVWLAALINIPCFFAAYTGFHETSHRNLHGRRGAMRWLNDVFGVLLGSMLLYPYSLHNYLHLTHHANTNDPDNDPDHWMSGATPGRLIARGLTLPWRYWAFMLDKRGREDGVWRFYLRLALELTPAFALLAALLAAGAWQVVAVAWIAALSVGVAILGLCFDWVVHHPHDERTMLRATRLFNVRNRVLRTVLNVLHLYQNYHLIHHIHPRTPFYRYEKVFRRAEGFLRAKGARIVDL